MKKIFLIYVGSILLLSVNAFAEDTYKLQILTHDKLPVNGIEWNDAYYRTCNGNETQDECVARYQKGIDEERAVRLANADEGISHPIIPPPPTKEQLIAQQTSIAEQKVQLDARIAEITAEIINIESQPIKEVVEEPIT